LEEIWDNEVEVHEWEPMEFLVEAVAENSQGSGLVVEVSLDGLVVVVVAVD
jgi:hypothetical protein